MQDVWREENLVQKWLDIEAALVKVFAEEGIIPEKAAEKIIALSSTTQVGIADIRAVTKNTRHIISGFVKTFRKKCGDEGEYYHLGTTTQDILDTGLVLLIKEGYAILWQEMHALQDAMLILAEGHKKTIMAGRTQGLQGLPITFGFKAAIWASELQDHIDRFYELRKRLFLVNISGAMGTKAGFSLLVGADRATHVEARVAELLDLDCPVIDLHHRTDRFAEMLNAIALLCSSLGEIGLELRDLQRTEVAEVAEPWESRIDGSSSMPHKRNPEPSHWLEGLAKITRANASAMMDMQVQHERDATRTAVEFACIPESFHCAAAVLRSSKDILKGLYIDTDRMRENFNLQQDLNLSEAVMLKLFQKSGRKIEAHGLVKACAARAFENRQSFRQALMDDPTVSNYLSRDEIETVLKPENYLGTVVEQVEAVSDAIKSKRKTYLESQADG
jgi:adenylosuccinate lyase